MGFIINMSFSDSPLAFTNTSNITYILILFESLITAHTRHLELSKDNLILYTLLSPERL